MEIIKSLQLLRTPFLDSFFSFFSNATSVFGAGLIFLVFMFYKKKFAFAYLYTLISSVTFGYILKFTFNRPRPYEIDNSIFTISEAFGKSMPSGHAIGAVVTICFLIYFVLTIKISRFAKGSLVGIFALFGALVCVSRVYLGVHFLSDVVVGGYIAIVLSIAGIICYNTLKERRRWKDLRLSQKTLMKQLTLRGF